MPQQNQVRTRRRGSRAWIVAAIAAATLAGAPLRAATPEDVDLAVQQGVKTLYTASRGDNWETATPEDKKTNAGQYGGVTALCTYALLAAGEKPEENPKLAGAVAWLKKTQLTGTYAVALRAQCWGFLPKDPTVRAAIKTDAELLLAGSRSKTNSVLGTYSYFSVGHGPGTYDHSCSQYGVLGMWAVERAGLEVPDLYWQAVDNVWRKDQLGDGSWGYAAAQPDKDPSDERTFNMTAAGLATLFITQDYLRSNEGISCKGNQINPPIAKGMAWMEKNLPDIFAKHHVAMYGIYGIERIGVASGYKYFGNFDWYKSGATLLVDQQHGKWDYHGASVGTSLALLFLCRGRAPVVMNKLQYSLEPANGAAAVEANWNERPRDAANAVRYVAKQMERDLNWQIVNLKVPETDLHDAPILYIAGNQLLKFTDDDQAKLKAFVENGGMILLNADCADPTFVKSANALGTKLFPAAGEFRKLDPSHPIFTRQQFPYKSWKTKPDVRGLSNGARELMILLPSLDPAKSWQISDYKGKEEYFQLMSDIFLYAVEGKELREKGRTYIVTPNAGVKASKTFEVARIQLGDNPDPEPGGWRRLAAVVHNVYSVDIKTTNAKPELAALKPYKLAHLTGTGKLKITDAEIGALKDYVTGGGTLLIDATGGDSAFGSSIEDALRTAFAADAKQLDEAIPESDPIWKATGSSLGTVAYRSFARTVVPRDQTTPLIRGIKVNGRWGVLLSREDLSAGLVGEAVDGIIGYTPESATKIMTEVISYVGGQMRGGPAKPAKPATPAKK